MNYLRLLKQEKLKRLQRPRLNLETALFPQQLKAVRDQSTLVSVCTTRRGGKSSGFAGKALEIADKFPGCLIPYIALTRDSAERIMWPILRDFVERYKLPYTLLDSSLELKTPKGSKIFLTGADQKNFIVRLKGAKYPVAFVDEAQGFKSHIEELVDEVLEPAVSDYNGQVFVGGTPGVVPRGYFYDTTIGKRGFSAHKWSVVDNPHMPHIDQAWLEAMRLRKNWSVDNPTFRREWLGEWVEDLDALVYKFKEGNNEYSGVVPDKKWSILGVDLGFNDKATFSVVSWGPHSSKLYVEVAEGEAGMIPAEIAARIKQLTKKYSPSKIVVDSGALGKGIVEEFKRRYGIPALAAEKTMKMSWIRLMNGDFVDGNVLVHESLTDLKEEYQTLAKDEDGNEDEIYPNDHCDATLYAYRECRAYGWEPRPVKPQTSAEQFEEKEREWLAREDEIARKQARGEAWD